MHWSNFRVSIERNLRLHWLCTSPQACVLTATVTRVALVFLESIEKRFIATFS